MSLYDTLLLVFILLVNAASNAASTPQKPQATGAAYTCAPQGEYCHCKWGKVRYGLEKDWSEWTYVHDADRVLCDHGNPNFPAFQNVAWLYTKYCQCEALFQTADIKAGRTGIPEGTELYLFRVDAFETPTHKVGDKAWEGITKWVGDAKDHTLWEGRKQNGVMAVGLVAGIACSIFAGPVVAAALGTHMIALGAAAVIGAAGANYVATASAKAATRLLLDTDDKDKAMFDGREAFVAIGAGALTGGFAAGVGAPITHGLHQFAGAVHHSAGALHSGQHFINIGDKIVTWSGGTAVEVPFSQIVNQGLIVAVEAGDAANSREMEADESKIPHLKAQSTSLGIILNLLLSGVQIQSSMYGGGMSGYPALAENLKALEKSSTEILDQYGPGMVPDPRMIMFSIAERTVGNIFHPGHDKDEHFNNYPGARFPECKSVKASDEPVCYCIREGYIPKPDKGPEIGVDVDFCIYGQNCVPGSGVENAKCHWPNQESQVIMGRLFAAYAVGVKNCIAQHLNGYRCMKCQVAGESCITEHHDGECAAIVDGTHGYTCKRPGIPINPDGTPIRQNQKDNAGGDKNAPRGKIKLSAREIVAKADNPELMPRRFQNQQISEQTQNRLVVPPNSAASQQSGNTGPKTSSIGRTSQLNRQANIPARQGIHDDLPPLTPISGNPYAPQPANIPTRQQADASKPQFKIEAGTYQGRPRERHSETDIGFDTIKEEHKIVRVGSILDNYVLNTSILFGMLLFFTVIFSFCVKSKNQEDEIPLLGSEQIEVE